MRYLFILLLASNIAFAKEKQPLKVITPQEEDLMAEFEEFDPPKTSYVEVGIHGMSGGVYLGGRKTPAEFTLFKSDVVFQRNRLNLGLGVNYLFNQGATKSYNAYGKIGYNTTLSKLKFNTNLNLGGSYLSEKTEIQDIKGGGFFVGADASLSYNLNWVNLGLQVNYFHTSYSGSYYGTDVFKDLALDFFGAGVILQFPF